MIKAILVDLDGTLVDSTPALYQVYLKFLAHYTHQGTKEEFESLIGPSIDEIVTILQKKYQLPGTPQELSLMYVSMIMLQGFEGTALFPGAKEFIEEAKKKQIKLGIVTSGTKELVKVCLTPLHIHDDFEAVVTSEDVKKAKPSPEIYQIALTKLGVKPDEAVAIEDSSAGVKAAQEAGLKVVMLTHGKNNQSNGKIEGVIYCNNWNEMAQCLPLK